MSATAQDWLDAAADAPSWWGIEVAIALMEAGEDARIAVYARCGHSGKSGYCGKKAGAVVATPKGYLYFSQRPADRGEMTPSFRESLQDEIRRAKEFRARPDRHRQWRPTPVVESADFLYSEGWHPTAVFGWCPTHGHLRVDRDELRSAQASRQREVFVI